MKRSYFLHVFNNYVRLIFTQSLELPNAEIFLGPRATFIFKIKASFVQVDTAMPPIYHKSKQ